MLKKQNILLHAKSFLASPIQYLAAWQRFFSLGTQAEWWSKHENLNPNWDERTALIAGMIAPNASVLEFGSGREQLQKFLPEGCTYQPSDIVKRSERTLVCDLNKEFPALKQKYDVIVFSGVLEYIADIPQLLRRVRESSNSCIFSYVSTDNLNCMATRLQNGWVNHFSEAEILEYIKKAGFRVTQRKMWQGQVIFSLVPASHT